VPAEFHAFAPLEASRRVTNGIPLGCPLFLPVHTVNCVQTLKAVGMQECMYVPDGHADDVGLHDASDDDSGDERADEQDSNTASPDASAVEFPEWLHGTLCVPWILPTKP
jgi:hypothetical protein